MRLQFGKNIFLLMASLLLWHGAAVAEEDAVLSLKLPPASLAQWYKPQNKRHVWLHTMFSLRRSMQALQEYVERGEAVPMPKWAADFDKNYRKLGEMVPEWRDELELEWSAKLKNAAEGGDVEGVQRALGKVETSCRSCHNEYQLVSSVLYRTPDFSSISMTTDENKTLAFKELMNGMSRAVNQVKIFYEDEKREDARVAAVELQRLMQVSARSCSQCHKEEATVSRIFSETSDGYQHDLLSGIENGDAKRVNGNLGKIGAFVCARCHAVHKPVAELREMLQKKTRR